LNRVYPCNYNDVSFNSSLTVNFDYINMVCNVNKTACMVFKPKCRSKKEHIICCSVFFYRTYFK
jgi:hypothetical protein